MQNGEHSDKNTVQGVSSRILKKRSGQERRKDPSRGHTCISMVGWICRREWLRRKDDPDNFTNDIP